MAKVKVSMVVDIDDNDISELMRITHHIEEFVDMDSWSEINFISDVAVEEID